MTVPSHVSTIPPVLEGEPRPRWSVMIPTYNCASFLHDALGSVLRQDPGPEVMQIEVVDDCSKRDDPEAVVAELGRGRVAFYRQVENVGHVENFNTCLRRSRGFLVHLLHGDDLVQSPFYERMESAFAKHPEIGAAFCRDIRVDTRSNWHSIAAPLLCESGVLPDWLPTIAVGQRLQASSMVVRRSVYEALGSFDRRISCYGEDWEMWVRIAAHYPVWYEVEPLATYRIHPDSLSGRSVADNGQDLRLVIDIIQAHLQDARAPDFAGQARKNFAAACIRRAHRALNRGDRSTALAHIHEAVRSSRSPVVLVRALLAFVRALTVFHHGQ